MNDTGMNAYEEIMKLKAENQLLWKAVGVLMETVWLVPRDNLVTPSDRDWLEQTLKDKITPNQ